MSTYYTGSDIVLRFLVTDDEEAISPTSATMKILKPNEEVVDLGEVTIEGNKIYAVIPYSQTTLAGKYMALFRMSLTGGLIRQHKIVVDVKDALAWP